MAVARDVVQRAVVVACKQLEQRSVVAKKQQQQRRDLTAKLVLREGTACQGRAETQVVRALGASRCCACRSTTCTKRVAASGAWSVRATLGGYGAAPLVEGLVVLCH